MKLQLFVFIRVCASHLPDMTKIFVNVNTHTYARVALDKIFMNIPMMGRLDMSGLTEDDNVFIS